MFTSSWMSKPILNEMARGKVPKNPIRARLLRMEDVRNLAGTMNPYYFTTKVIRYLSKNYPGLESEDLTDENLKEAMRIVASLSRKLDTRSDIKLDTQPVSTGREALDWDFFSSPEEQIEDSFRKGKTGWETLSINLGPDALFTFDSTDSYGNEIYTHVKGDYRYRITIKPFNNQQPIKFEELNDDLVGSVIITKAGEKENVKWPSIDSPGPETEREPMVADYPNKEFKGDWSKTPELDEEELKKSPQEINRMLQQQFKEQQKHRFSIDRKYGLGY